MISLTPMEPWIAAKIGLGPGQPLTREALENYQLDRLADTIGHARANSPFYRERLAGRPAPASLADLARFPFTTPADVRADDRRFICVPQGEIERVVTLYSSGTTAPPKRLHFTSSDLELTADFFHHGMATLVQPGEKVLILMPGELPGSVGDLLARGLARLGVEGIVHGLVTDREKTLAEMEAQRVTCLVGLPVQLLGLARHPRASRVTTIGSILVSADYAPAVVREALSRAWRAPVFDHYGMTEMGLGGAVECAARNGYHPREADLLFEIVDPASGDRLPDGEPGEVVFTTLTRRGMPLIRYRTGDLARLLPEPCPCGSLLRRLERVRGRLAGTVALARGGTLNITELDELLFPLPFLLDYRVTLSRREGRELLSIALETTDGNRKGCEGKVREALLTHPVIAAAVSAGELVIPPPVHGSWSPSATIKRSITLETAGGDCRREPVRANAGSSQLPNLEYIYIREEASC